MINKNEYFHELIKIPAEVKSLQEWFAKIISQPFIEIECRDVISINENTTKKEATYFLSSSPYLEPHQGIEIYNKQYWWRLINIMGKNFPLILRLLGYARFEKIVVQYLLKYPSNSWCLTIIGKNFPKWIKENCKLTDAKLLFQAAEIDLYFYLSSIALHSPPISQENIKEKNFLNENINLQPHIFLLKSSYDLPSIREIIIKNNTRDLVDNYLPESLKARIYFVIFRNNKNNISWKKIHEAEYLLLRLFKKRTTILKSCDWIKIQNSFLQEIMAKEFPIWIQSWIQLEWLILSKRTK